VFESEIEFSFSVYEESVLRVSCMLGVSKDGVLHM